MRVSTSCSQANGSTGPPPWEWRDEIRASHGHWCDAPKHVGARLGRSAVAHSRVKALPVVEHLDILEHRSLGLLAGAQADVVHAFFLQRGEKLSMGALSRQLPRRLMDCVMPCRSSMAR